MAETLIDPLPPTVREGSEKDPPPGGAGPGRGRARSSGCRVVAVLLGAALVVLGGLGLVVYFFFWRYEPLALEHVPETTTMVFRFDGQRVVTFAPVRKHLWPMLLEEKTSSGKLRRARIKEATGVDLALDVREIVVASTDATSWVLLAGGRIQPGGFVKGMEALALEESWPLRREGQLLKAPGGFALAQAEDGTLVAGTDEAIVTAALPRSDAGAKLGLSTSGAATFLITRDAWAGAAPVAESFLPRQGALLRRVDRAAGSFELGDAPQLALRLTPARGEAPETLSTDVGRVLGELRLLTLLLPDRYGEKAALRQAAVRADGADVLLEAPWAMEGLDRAMADLARVLRASGAASSVPGGSSPARAPAP